MKFARRRQNYIFEVFAGVVRCGYEHSLFSLSELLVILSVYNSPRRELRDNGVVQNLQFWPQSFGVVLEFSYIQTGYFFETSEVFLKTILTSNSSFCLLTVSKSSPTGSSLSVSLSALRRKLSTEASRSSQSWSLFRLSRWSLLEASSILEKGKTGHITVNV